MKTYNPKEVNQKLKELKNWIHEGNSLEGIFTFKNFSEALGFIVRIGLLAEQADHHPEIYNVYNKVRIRLNTHSAGGITDKDFSLAVKIDALD